VAFKCLTNCATDTSHLMPLHLWILSYFIVGEREKGSNLISPKCGEKRGPGGRRYSIWCIAAFNISPHPDQNHSHVFYRQNYFSCIGNLT
jgi:hypothetical protein